MAVNVYRIYRAIQGDAWDSIAYKLWGEERLAHLLMQANPEYMDMLLFPAGVELHVPEVEKPQRQMDVPAWV